MSKDIFLNREEVNIQNRIDTIGKAIGFAKESLEALKKGRVLERDRFNHKFIDWFDYQIKEYYEDALKKLKKELAGNRKLLNIIKNNNK